MKKNSWWLVTCLIVATALLASCAKESTTTAPVTASPTTAPSVTTTPPQTTAAAEEPKYGGTLAIMLSQDITGFDLTSSPVNGATLPLTNGTLIGGDWAKGPAGTNEVSWTNMGYYGMGFERGNLAESWEITGIGTWIFRIRKGVHFALDPTTRQAGW